MHEVTPDEMKALALASRGGHTVEYECPECRATATVKLSAEAAIRLNRPDMSRASSSCTLLQLFSQVTRRSCDDAGAGGRAAIRQLVDQAIKPARSKLCAI
jgi:hypothetical protein